MTNANPPRMPTRPIDETARLGREIYLETILPMVEADHFGEYVLIDVDTGEWAMAETARAARQLLREKNPDAFDLWCERVGFKAPRSFGAGALLGRPEMPESLKKTKGHQND